MINNLNVMTVSGGIFNSLTNINYAYADSLTVFGNQNHFFDMLYCSVTAHLTFRNSTETYFSCRTIRVWVPNNSTVSGYYYIQGYPEGASYKFIEGSTTSVPVEGGTSTDVNFHDFTWIKIDNGVTNTIAYNSTLNRWELIVNNSTISTSNYRNLPINGSYGNISGVTPLIVWSDYYNPPTPVVHEDTVFKLAIGNLDNYGSTGISYGFTPHMIEGSTCTVDWGDGTVNTYTDQYSDNLILHDYTIAPVHDTTNGTYAFLVTVTCQVTNIRFGFNRDYYNIAELSGGTITGGTVTFPVVGNSTGQSGTTYTSENRLVWKKITSTTGKNYRGYNNKLYPLPITSDEYNSDDYCHYIEGGTISYYEFMLDPYDYNELTSRVLSYNYSGNGWVDIESGYCMFNNCNNLNTEQVNRLLQISSSGSTSCQFNQITSLPENIIDGSYMFRNCASAEFDGLLIILSGCTNGFCMFAGCDNAQFSNLLAINNSTINNDILDDKLLYGDFMFSGIRGSTAFPQLFRLPKSLINANNMFYQANGLSSINLSGCTSLVNGSYMFAESTSKFNSLTDLPPNLTYAVSMFEGCSNATFNGLITLSTNTLVDTTNMFIYCSGATFSNLSSLGSAIKYSDHMFDGCYEATFSSLSSLSNNLVTMSYMFYDCNSVIFGSNPFSNNNLTNLSIQSYNFGNIGLISGADYSFNNIYTNNWNQLDYFDSINRILISGGTYSSTTQVDLTNTFEYNSTVPLTSTYVVVAPIAGLSYNYSGKYTYNSSQDLWINGSYSINMNRYEIYYNGSTIAEYHSGRGWYSSDNYTNNPWYLLLTKRSEWLYRNNYDERLIYNIYDIVYYMGAFYLSLSDDNTLDPTYDGSNPTSLWRRISDTGLSSYKSAIDIVLSNPNSYQFSASTSYQADSIVIYKDNLYRCINATSGKYPGPDLLVRYTS